MMVKSFVNNGEKSVNSKGKRKAKKILHYSKQFLYQNYIQQNK